MGIFELGNQACLMKQFVEGAVEKPSWGDVGAACAERERDVSKDRVQSAPALPQLPGLPQRQQRGLLPSPQGQRAPTALPWEGSSALRRSLG